MKKSFIFSIIMLLVACIAVLGATYGWFVASRATENVTFETGSVHYVLTGGLKDSSTLGNVIPGQELVIEDSPIGIENYSSIESQLRVKIAYQFEDGEVITFTSENTNTSSVDVQVLGVVGDNFIYNEIDGYWYYYYGVENPVIPAYDELESILTIEIISSLYTNGNVTGSNLMTKKIGLVIIFEAKQKKNVSWEDIEWDVLSTTLIEN
ncbi:MAG: hypothetical protein PHO86_03480 [Bacilli bacterium]|nr:hypothetical protein [Bacilli bacterium]